MNTPMSCSFSETGGKNTISFTCNREWHVSSSESWLKVSPSSGEANEKEITVTITCEANTTYDDRECKITVTTEGLSETISVTQKTTLGLFASPNIVEISPEAQAITINAQSNVQYLVEIDEEAKDWITHVPTKGLSESAVSFQIARNDGYDRTGKIFLKYDNLQEMITIKQRYGYVIFDDVSFKSYCLESFDTDGDGKISIKEANAVEEVNCPRWDISSLKGIEFFISLKTLNINGNIIHALDLSKCTLLQTLNCGSNQLASLDISSCANLQTLDCSYNGLQEINLSACVSLQTIDCCFNGLTSLDLSGCPSLLSLNCFLDSITELRIDNNSLQTLIFLIYYSIL